MNAFDFSHAVALCLNKQRRNAPFIETLTAEARDSFRNVPEKFGRHLLDDRSVDPFSVLALMFTHRLSKNFTYESARRQMCKFLPYLEMEEADLPDEEEWNKAVKVSKEQRKFFNHKDSDGNPVSTERWWDLLECALSLAAGEQKAQARFAELYTLFRNKNGFTQALHWIAPNFYLSLENADARRAFSDKLSASDMAAKQYLEFCRRRRERAAAENLTLAEMQAQERLRAAKRRESALRRRKAGIEANA